jgi:hypothetical protein
VVAEVMAVIIHSEKMVVKAAKKTQVAAQALALRGKRQMLLAAEAVQAYALFAILHI